MEEQKEPEGGARELKQDALVEKLVVDPTKNPDVQVLVGLLGRSSEAGNWRLYFTPQLDNYVEFSAGDVVHTQPLDAARSPLGGTMIWLRRDATLKHMRTGTRQAQAEFVQGDIMSRFVAGTGRSGIAFGGLVGPMPVNTLHCNTAIAACFVTALCDSLTPIGCTFYYCPWLEL